MKQTTRRFGEWAWTTLEKRTPHTLLRGNFWKGEPYETDPLLRVELSRFQYRVGIGVSRREDNLAFNLGCGWTVYLSRPWRMGKETSLGAEVYAMDGRVHAHIHVGDPWEYSSERSVRTKLKSWWSGKSGVFSHYMDLTAKAFGEADRKCTTLADATKELLLPEGSYPISLSVTRVTSTRPRWPLPVAPFGERFTVLSMKPSVAIPILTRKGPTTLHGQSAVLEYRPGYSYDQAGWESDGDPEALLSLALLQLQRSILMDRLRYGGLKALQQPYPSVSKQEPDLPGGEAATPS